MNGANTPLDKNAVLNNSESFEDGCYISALACSLACVCAHVRENKDRKLSDISLLAAKCVHGESVFFLKPIRLFVDHYPPSSAGSVSRSVFVDSRMHASKTTWVFAPTIRRFNGSSWPLRSRGH